MLVFFSEAIFKSKKVPARIKRIIRINLLLLLLDVHEIWPAQGAALIELDAKPSRE